MKNKIILDVKHYKIFEILKCEYIDDNEIKKIGYEIQSWRYKKIPLKFKYANSWKNARNLIEKLIDVEYLDF